MEFAGNLDKKEEWIGIKWMQNDFHIDIQQSHFVEEFFI